MSPYQLVCSHLLFGPLWRSHCQASKITITVSDEVTECVPTNITWYGGTPPYTLGVRVGSFDDEPEEVYTNISTKFFLWSTDVASNNFVVFAVGDNLTIANSDFIEMQAGLTQSCVPDALVPFTSTVGGGGGDGSHTTKTQGAPASGSPTGQPPSTSQSVTSTTVTVSVTDSVGGTNPATPGTTNTSSASSSSHSSLSPDVIGIIVAVAFVLLIVVIWVFYKCSTRTKPVLSSTSTSNVSTPLAPAAAGPVAPYLGPPTSPTVRATSILSASPNFSPVGSPSMSALQFAPYGYSPPASSPPALATHPTWQGAAAAAVHTTQTQTYFVGNPATLAPRGPSVLSGQHEPARWNPNMQEAYVGQTQWLQETAPLEQGRLAASRDAGEGPGVASTEGGSDSLSWRAMLAPPHARRP
ncbi:hypothetical protein V8D89_000424 [Ganoderma adspersum]